jgi:hypothetical protein
MRQGSKLLVCDKPGAGTLPGCPVPSDQRVDLALVQHLCASGGKRLPVRLRYADCEMSEGGNGRNERCVLFFTCELMDGNEQPIQAPDWPKIVDGTRWETMADLMDDDTCDITAREMLKRVISWESREGKYR